MATKYGHIYTKNNSGSVDKFVPILNSTDIKHGDEDNVGEILDKSAKSVETEIENVENTTVGPINEVIFDGVNSYGYISVGNDSHSMLPDEMYSSYDYDNLTELNTNERFTSSQFQISSTGFVISFEIENDDDVIIYAVTSNFSTVSNSPYAHDDNSDHPFSISSSELPSVGQSKDFYPTLHVINNRGWKEYTGTDIKFTITNIDGTYYTLSFIWEKTETVTVTTKSLKTTVTKNDDTETEETNEISGLLQNSNITFEQKLVTAQLYDIQANIEVWADN